MTTCACGNCQFFDHQSKFARQLKTKFPRASKWSLRRSSDWSCQKFTVRTADSSTKWPGFGIG
jgi:hypothetical protein